MWWSEGERVFACFSPSLSLAFQFSFSHSLPRALSGYLHLSVSPSFFPSLFLSFSLSFSSLPPPPSFSLALFLYLSHSVILSLTLLVKYEVGQPVATCDMPHTWRSRSTRMHESCHKFMSHIWRSHVTHMYDSCHAYWRVTSHVSMSHPTHQNTSSPTHEYFYNTHESVISQIQEERLEPVCSGYTCIYIFIYLYIYT